MTSKPPVTKCKFRKSPRKVKRRPPGNRGLEQNTLEALGELHWFLVRVPSTKEFVLERILDDNGVIAFVPIERRFNRQNGYAKKRKELRFPLMPGYLLVGFVQPTEAAWATVLRFSLVRGVIGNQGQPVRVPSVQIVQMLQRHTAKEFIAPRAGKWMRSSRDFVPGDTVEVLDGPFAGQIFELSAVKGDSAVMVVEMFGGEKKMSVPLSGLGRVA